MVKLQEQRYHGDLSVEQAIMRLNLGKAVTVALYDSSNTIVIDCTAYGRMSLTAGLSRTKATRSAGQATARWTYRLRSR